MLIALSLVAALSAQDAPPAPPRVERDVRIVRADGAEGAGRARLDKDGDGFISREEYVGPTTEAFTVLDRNSDDRISTEELAEGPAVARTILGDAGGPGGGVHVIGGPGGAMFGGRRGGPEGPMIFTMRRGGGEGGPPALFRLGDGDGPDDLDTDKDGKVSEAEFLAPLRDAFRRMDKDGSGSLEDGEHGDGANVHVFTRRIERSSN